jgi:hypothetical protein
MEEYIRNFETFEKKVVYDFKLGCGGIGDCVKFFTYLMQICLKNKIRLYYLINNIPIEKYLKMKYDKMYIERSAITYSINVHNEAEFLNGDPAPYYFVDPHIFHSYFTFDMLTMECKDIFDFSDDVKINASKLLPNNITNYISIHLRMGDKFLEKDPNFNICPFDTRDYNETNIHKCIEGNADKQILFFCDNIAEKLNIKNKYNNVIITDSEVAHTGHFNTTDKQVLDTITEFYLLTNAEKIIMASYSGFSIVASKFKNAEVEKIY